MKVIKRSRFLAVASASALLGLAGCASTPRDSAALSAAREAVSQAANDPDVTRHAPTDLQRARNLLVNAESAAEKDGADAPVAAHYAYLSQQVAGIAVQRAREQVAIARVKEGEAERQRILVAARESEAMRAQSAAEQARNEAQNAQSQLAQAQAESQRLAAQLQDMQARQTSRGLVLTLDDVLFDTGKAQLKSGSLRVLDQVAEFLEQNPERHVQVEGFTDSQGTDDFNLQLSQNRADAVAQAIIQRGIAAERVRARGYGEQYPVASNSSAGSRQLNRRVEIVVSNDEAAIPTRSGERP
jgi:outer membrane protein OmpA-like peptidoglycan-associated protein